MNDFKITTPIEHKEQRVLTTAQLAEAYGTNSRRISENFNYNRERFIEGKHFYCLKGEELEKFLQYGNCGMQNIKKVRVMYLWTERGALLHAKSLNTDKAWEVYEFLVDTYFKVREVHKFYNEDIYQKLEVLEQKIDALEKNSYDRNNDIIKNIKESIFEITYNTVQTLIPCFEVIYKQLKKKHERKNLK